MCGEAQFAGLLVERFASYHRQNYGGCKTGVADVLIGATTALAEYNGVAGASHVRDKVVEMGFAYEIARLSQDIAGGFIATLPTETDLKDPVIGPYVDKYFKGVASVPTEHRIRIARLLENMSGGTALVESLHGAGSPQAQRVMILRQANLEAKKKLAQRLAGIE
jgi:4-hydroxybutyryl-CoA dehydratase/vinylacetyl-CoA-Delta-isomerase